MIFGRKKSDSESVDESSILNKETEGLSQGQIVRKKFLQHKAAMIAVFVLSSIVIFVFSALKQKIGPWTYPGWWKYGIEDLSDLTTGCKDGLVGCPTASLRPQWLGGAGIGLGEHPFGQDDIGRDYFALVMRGAQRSLMVTVIIGAIGGVIGTVSGMIFALDRGSVQPDNYSRDLTFYILTALVLGGVAKVSGSIFGSMMFWGLFTFMDNFLRQVAKDPVSIGNFTIMKSTQVGQLNFILIGITLILLMVFRPQGVFGNRKEMAFDGH